MLSPAAPMPALLNPHAAGAAAPPASNPTVAGPGADAAAACFQSLLLPVTATLVEAPASALPDAAQPEVDVDEELEAGAGAEDAKEAPSAQALAMNLLLQWLHPAPATSSSPPSSRLSASAPGSTSTNEVPPQVIAPLLPALAASTAAAAITAPSVETSITSPPLSPASADVPIALDAAFKNPLEAPASAAPAGIDAAPAREAAPLLTSPPGANLTEAPAPLAQIPTPTLIVETGARIAAPPVPAGPPPQALHTTEPDWPLALGEHITWSLDHQQAAATIELHPAELGSLVVRIETRGGDAQVTIIAATAAARDLLQQSLPQLRELLMVQGLNLSRAQIDRPSAAGQGAQQDLQSFRERGQGSGGRRRVGRLLLVDAYA